MEKQVKEIIANLGEPTFMRSELRTEGMGYGFINAARGSLGHWLKVRGGKIENYQVITPTTWNGSPRDSWGRRGHWEESFIGLEIGDLDNPVEVGGVAGLNALAYFEGCRRAIIVDGLKSAGEVGSVHRLGMTDLSDPELEFSLHSFA